MKEYIKPEIDIHAIECDFILKDSTMEISEEELDANSNYYLE